MTGSFAAKTSRRKTKAAAGHQGANAVDKKAGGERLFDREMEALPPDLRWREWMLRVEAVTFAAAEPVTRETLARVVGRDCSIDLLITDLRQELSGRPYEIVPVAGGWQHRSRPAYADAIRASAAPTRGGGAALSEFESMVLLSMSVQNLPAYWEAKPSGGLPSYSESVWGLCLRCGYCSLRLLL